MSTNIEIRNVVIGATVGAFIVGEVPGGSMNGVNLNFTLLTSPATNREEVFLNGVRQKKSLDYTLSSNILTFSFAPIPGDILLADYNY